MHRASSRRAPTEPQASNTQRRSEPTAHQKGSVTPLSRAADPSSHNKRPGIKAGRWEIMISMSRQKITLLSLLLMLAVSATATASASALHWYILSGSTEKKLGEGAANGLKIEATGTERYTLSFALLGVLSEITCNKSLATGTIENPTGGASGLGLLLMHWLECEVKRPVNSGCIIPNELLHASTLFLLKTSPGGETLFLFSPDPSQSRTFIKITYEHCSNSIFDGVGLVEGMANGTVAGSAGDEVKFEGGAPNNELQLDGNEVTFTGTSLLFMAGAPTVSIMTGT
jgi:hypothetical protein